MLNEAETEILNVLIGIRDGRIQIDHLYGICYQLEHSLYINGDLLSIEIEPVIYPIFKKWPYYSGDEAFPIPDPNCEKTACDIYCFSTRDGMWDKETDYGELRWNLLNFMIKELQK